MTAVLDILMIVASGCAGAGVAYILRLPMWPLTGAILAVAALQTVADGLPGLPAGVGFAAQVFVGCAVGSRLQPSVLRRFTQIMTPGLIIIVVLVAAGVGLGVALASLGLLDPPVAVLGAMPGGVGEMVAATASLGGDSSVVAVMHLARLLLVVLTVPALVALVRRLQPVSAESKGSE